MAIRGPPGQTTATAARQPGYLWTTGVCTPAESLSHTHTQMVSPTHAYGVSHAYGALTQSLTHIWCLAQNTHTQHQAHTQAWGHATPTPGTQLHTALPFEDERLPRPFWNQDDAPGLCLPGQGACARATGDTKAGGRMQRRSMAPGSFGEKAPEEGAPSMGSSGVRRQVGAFLAPSDTSRPYSHQDGCHHPCPRPHSLRTSKASSSPALLSPGPG